MIKVLDEKLVNKIAAGEVIEKPLNVVKELVENSLDAGAQNIFVEINEDLIRVEDDGNGMSKEDLEKCVLRHATSKINDFEDLINVGSFGFRGEALSSIAAVSDLTIISKFKDSLEGNELRVEGGVLRNLRSLGCSKGTIIILKDLFFNTPVRKKFLDLRENERIVDFLERFVLLNSVRLKLKLNGKVVLDVNAENLKDRIAQVYGLEVVKHLEEINHEELGVKISGYVSNPSFVRSDRKMQSFFVNNRLVESDEIKKGLYDAYKSILFVNKHPFAVLNLEMSGVDVNVHPAKKIVNFSLPDIVYSSVFNAVRENFKEKNVEFEVKQEVFSQVFKKEKKVEFKERFQKDKQVEFVENKEEGFSKLPEMRILGVVNKTYFLAEVEDGLMVIDQHVVEERITYEKFMKEFMEKKVEVQELLSPELIEFSLSESLKVKQNLEKLKGFGFYLEEFGENNFRLRKVPLLFGIVKGEELLKEILVDFKENKKEEIITRMSCRSSIKAGDLMSVSEMYAKLKILDKCELPYTCPHGRPIMVKLSVDDLEKMFRRKGF